MFVIAHETFHVLLDHLKLIASLEFPEIGNIACDAVINDLLVKQFNFVIPDVGLVTGMDLLKEDCSDKSAEYVYNKIISEKIIIPVYVSYDYQEGISDGEMGDLKDDSDSQSGNQVVSKGKVKEDKKEKDGEGKGENDGKEDKESPKPIDNHQNWTKEDSDILSENIPITYDESTHVVKSRGFAAGNMEFAIQKVKNKFDLKKLVKNIVGKRLKEEFNENWRKYNYKLSYVYPDVVLPYQDSNEVTEKLGLLFCIDTSGSISDILIQEFIAIAKNHLEDFDVTAVTFDTRIYEIDLKKSKTAYGRGGTSFQAVADYVVQNKEKDFDAVMVLTDSYGGTIKETPKLNFKKWFWVITPYGEKVPDYMGKSFFIPNDYIKY